VNPTRQFVLSALARHGPMYGQALYGRAALFARARAHAWPDQGPADDLVIGHALARIETELRWHDMVLDRIGKLAGHQGVAATAACAGTDRSP
jgi:hypothetical protein